MYKYPIFDRQTVAANTLGELTSAQEDMLNAHRGCYRSGLLIAVIGTGVSLLLPIGLFISTEDMSDPNMQEALPFILGPLGLVFVLVLLWIAFGVYRSRDVGTGKISEVEGPAKIWSKTFRMRGGSLHTAHYLKIGKLRFQFGIVAS